MLKADGPHCSNYFNYNIDGGKHVSCCTTMSRKLLSLPGIAYMYTFLNNTWNTLPESYQQRVDKHTPATVKRQIQHGENPMPDMVISMQTACVDNTIILNYLSSEVALEKYNIGSTEHTILGENNWADNKRQFWMAGGSRDYEDEGDERNKCDAILTPSQQQQAVSEFERFDLGTSDVDGYNVNAGNDADADE